MSNLDCAGDWERRRAERQLELITEMGKEEVPLRDLQTGRHPLAHLYRGLGAEDAKPRPERSAGARTDRRGGRRVAGKRRVHGSLYGVALHGIGVREAAFGGNDRIRTCDLALMKRPLCR